MSTRRRRPLRPRELRRLRRGSGHSDPVIVLSLAVVFIFSVVSLHLLSKGAFLLPSLSPSRFPPPRRPTLTLTCVLQLSASLPSRAARARLSHPSSPSAIRIAPVVVVPPSKMPRASASLDEEYERGGCGLLSSSSLCVITLFLRFLDILAAERGRERESPLEGCSCLRR